MGFGVCKEGHSSCGGERSIKRGTLRGRLHSKYHPDIVPTAQRVRLRPRASDLPKVTEQSILLALHEARTSESTKDSIRGLAVWRGHEVPRLNLRLFLHFCRERKANGLCFPFIHRVHRCSLGFL